MTAYLAAETHMLGSLQSRPQRSFGLLLRWLVLCTMLSACASYTDETKEIRNLYKDQNYQGALTKLEASSLKESSSDRLLYPLEKAMIVARLGDVTKARALLTQADKIADELYTTSISKTAASFVVSDSSGDYDGEDYEKVAIHTELALSFIDSGDMDAARVEAAKINNKLAEINSKYDSNKDRYGEDGFARLLSASIYEAKKEPDDAIIDYTKALALYRGSFKDFVDGGIPGGLVSSLYRLLVERGRTDKLPALERDFPREISLAKHELSQEADSAEVIVFHELGHIATKTAEDFFFPVGRQLVRFSFPVIKKSHHSYYGQTGVTDQGSRDYGTAENAEDLDSIAKYTLEDRKARMIVKESARLIAKGVLTEQAYQHFGILGGIAANIFSVISETADTRSWTLLPEGFYISRLRLKPGEHTLRIQTAGRLGKIEKVNLKRGQVLLLHDAG